MSSPLLDSGFSSPSLEGFSREFFLKHHSVPKANLAPAPFSSVTQGKLGENIMGNPETQDEAGVAVMVVPPLVRRI